MPSFTFKSAVGLTTGTVYQPLIGWQYEYTPFPSVVKLITNYVGAATDNVNLSISSGSEQIQESSPIQGGGTANVLPSELNTPSVSWVAPAGDRLKLIFNVTTGSASTQVQGTIYINPVTR